MRGDICSFKSKRLPFSCALKQNLLHYFSSIDKKLAIFQTVYLPIVAGDLEKIQRKPSQIFLEQSRILTVSERKVLMRKNLVLIWRMFNYISNTSRLHRGVQFVLKTVHIVHDFISRFSSESSRSRTLFDLVAM